MEETQNYKANWISINLVGSNKWRGMHKDSVLMDPIKAAAKTNNKFTNKIKYKDVSEVAKVSTKIKWATCTQMATKEVKDNRQDSMGWVGKFRNLIWDDLVESKT